jgi:hypothetical protein
MNEMHELNSQELLSQFLKVQIQFISSEQYEPLNTQPTNGTNPEHKFFVNGMWLYPALPMIIKNVTFWSTEYLHNIAKQTKTSTYRRY